MTEQKTVYLTEEGIEKLEKELHHLRTKERPRISNEIAEARAKGDISENAEYDAAKEAQGKVEARIAKLENTLANARIVDENTIDPNKAYILSNVRFKNRKTGTEQTIKLVAEEESNPAEGKISVSSPIGKGLLGHEVGDVIDVEVPAGEISLEILEISRGDGD